MSHLTNFAGAPAVRDWPLCPPRSERTGSLLAAACFAIVTTIGAAMAQEPHSNPWLLTWISPVCCVTNDCCWEVSERELRPLPEDEWQVVSTGQVRKRTDWSPDGRFYRCACDYNVSEGKWIRHDGAHTRCIFVPLRNASVVPQSLPSNADASRKPTFDAVAGARF